MSKELIVLSFSHKMFLKIVLKLMPLWHPLTFPLKQTHKFHLYTISTSQNIKNYKCHIG